jgi:hypothetical protein
VLAAMLAACQARPSLAQPLRGAAARIDGDVLSLDVGPDFAGFAEMHVDEYQALAKTATGRALKVQVGRGAAAAEAKPAPSPAEVRKERLRQEAEREPAVQEALDLFDGKLVDVRESKPTG